MSEALYNQKHQSDQTSLNAQECHITLFSLRIDRDQKDG